MNQKLLTMLKSINSYSQKHRNTTWCIPLEEGEFLHFLVSALKPKDILEIGTSIGFSTLWLASAASEYGGNVKTIEINEERASCAEENFRRAKLNNIKIIVGDAGIIIKKLRTGFDFIFLDCGKRHYLEQLLILEENGCIKDKTVVAADNARIISGKENKNLVQYLGYVRRNYVSCYVPFENGMEVSVKSVKAKM